MLRDLLASATENEVVVRSLRRQFRLARSKQRRFAGVPSPDGPE